MVVMWSILRSDHTAGYHKILICLNVIAMSYVVFMTLLCGTIAMLDAIPLLYTTSATAVLMHRCASLYLLVQVVGNFVLAYRTDSSVHRLRGHGIDDCDLRQTCVKCCRHVPRRCHHCALCNVCILKRDHHCYFMCTCIGYHNQKYFITFCLYTVISAMYGCQLGAEYMDLLYEVRSTSRLWWVYNMPLTIWRWLTSGGSVRYPQVIIAILYHNAVVSLIVASGFLVWQTYITFNGQTSYEAKRGIKVHSKTIKENFYDTFGPYWYVTLVLPIPLPQQGHGVYLMDSDAMHCDRCKNM